MATAYCNCGCRRVINIAGQRFGRLVAKYHVGKNKHGRHAWMCVCDCGREIAVSSNSLRAGNATSCGCYKLEIISKQSLSHGMSRTPEYIAWCAMKSRCGNPHNQDYEHYKAKGITVYEEWDVSFESFISHIGKMPSQRMTVDRIDNAVGYFPGNVRWATRTTQNRNRSNNRLLTCNGMTMTISEWSNYTGIPQSRIGSRLSQGMSDAKALSAGDLRHKSERVTTEEYKLSRIYDAIKTRCYNPKCQAFKNYGARGITMCEKWRTSLKAFISDVSPRPKGYVLDRKDNDGPYSPENCKWSTRKESSRNTRRNRFIEWNGESKTISEWSECVGIANHVITGRIERGWSIERTLTIPTRLNH